MPLTSPAELVAVGLSADRTIAVEHAVARALRRRLHPADGYRVVTNASTLARWTPAPAKRSAPPGRRSATGRRSVVLILAGRKDQHLVVTGLAALQRTGGGRRASGSSHTRSSAPRSKTVPARTRVALCPYRLGRSPSVASRVSASRRALKDLHRAPRDHGVGSRCSRRMPAASIILGRIVLAVERRWMRAGR